MKKEQIIITVIVIVFAIIIVVVKNPKNILKQINFPNWVQDFSYSNIWWWVENPKKFEQINFFNSWTPTQSNNTAYTLTDTDKQTLDKSIKSIDNLLASSSQKPQVLLQQIQDKKSKQEYNSKDYIISNAIENHIIDYLSKTNNNWVDQNIIPNDSNVEKILLSMCDKEANKLKNRNKVYLALYRNWDPYDYNNYTKYYNWNSFLQYSSGTLGNISLHILEAPINDFTWKNRLLDPINLLPMDYISCRHWSKLWENVKYIYCEWSKTFSIDKKIWADGQVISNWWSKSYFLNIVLNITDQAIEWPEYQKTFADFQKDKEKHWKFDQLDNAQLAEYEDHIKQKIDKKYRRYFFVWNFINATCSDTSSTLSGFKYQLSKE